MDFFGIIYDIKNGKKVPYSKTYFDTLFAAKLGGSDVKTLTGTLPLTFRTSETALRSWTIYGADIEHVETSSGKSITFYTDEDKLRDWTIYGNAEGVGERTKNLLSVEDYRQPAQTSITIDICDNETGRLKFAKTGTAQNRGLAYDGINFVDGQTYHFSFFNNAPQNDETGGRICLRRSDNNSIISGYTKTLRDAGFNEYSITFDATQAPNGAYLFVMSNGTSSATAEVDISNFMVRIDGTTAGFIPFGYQIPITVSQTGQRDKNYDIFIGDSPLTEGETVSKSSTGVDIATADGNNTITTSLYNQPDMSITYNEFMGVGIHDANVFMIALKLKAGGSTENVFNMLMNKPLRAGETLTSEQTGKTIKTIAGVENKLSPSPKAAAYGGNFEMTIKFKE